MSPAAAVEFQSSVTNTNPNLTSFSSTDDLSQTRPSGTAQSSSLGNAGEFDFGVGVGAGKGNAFVSRMGTGRARPRLVKVRKQLGRSRNEAAETASGFNPFRLKGEDSGPVNSCSSTASLQNNGVLENLNSVVSDEASVNKFSFENNESVGFVFGAIRSDQVVENEVESVSNDVCKRMERVSEAEAEKLDKKGFVFGADLNNVGGELNLERSKTSEGTVKMGSYDERKVKLENEAECRNDSTLKFRFGGGGNDLFLNLSLEKGDFSENLESGSGSTSKSERSECNRNVGDSGLGFVFGASWFNSASNLISSESASSQNNGEKASNDHGKMNVENAAESQGVKATEKRFECNGRRWNEDYDQGVFVFGSGKRNSLGSNDCMSPKCPNGMKLNGKNFGNENNILRTENNNLDFDVDNKSKFVSEASGNVSSASITDPVFKLPNEMRKLNINDYENDDGAYKKYDSNKNFCTHAADTTFVFTSGVKPSSSSGESSDPTQKQKSGATASVERRPGENFRTGDSDHIVSENSCNIDNASLGTSNSKPSTFQEGLGKGTDSGLFSSCKAKSDPWTNLAAAPASLSSVSLDSQHIEYGSESPSTVGVQKTDENSPHGLSFTEFITPNWDPSSFKANLYPKQNKKPEVSAKSRSLQDKRSKKTRGKLKKPSFLKQGLKQVHVPEQSSSQEHSKSPECCSPMDFSPYMETSVGDQLSKEASVTSNESFCEDNICAPSTLHSSVTTNPNDEKLATAERLDFNIGDQKCREPNEEIFGYHHGSSHDVDYPPKEFVFGSETAYSRFNQEQAYNSGGTTSVDHADGLNTEIPSGVEDRKHFTFSASSTAEGTLTLRRRQLRKISKKKAGKHSFIISPSPNVKFSSFSVHGQREDNYTSKSKVENKSGAAEQVKQGFASSVDSSQEACEMWRLRGNQAYKDGCLSQAEEFYTQGITSVPLSETAGCCIKPLVLCYSNRAAARISLGRMREALEDCVMATAMDPNFLKVYVRAAKCHLVLGEVENAVQNYNKLLESGTGICLDRRITIEAAEGLQKAQKVAKCTNHSAKLLEQKTSEAASEALETITEALFISSCSEKLLEMKAEALYMLRKYQDAIQLCELTLHRAENNFSSVGNDNCSLAMLWRWRLISKSYFCMGKLEAALDLLQKLEQVRCVMDKHGNEILESSTTLAATIRELLHRKNAGNEAVRSGKYTEAVEHYTIALSSNIESRPFAAICFCNRAAAFQALGQIPDAVADCSLAMALDGSYTKAVSRRAVLHEMIRDYAQAASDLQRLVSILENRVDEKTKRSGSPSKSNGSKEIRQARRQMSLMEEEAKKGVPLDFYLILGVKASDAASDIKKAYRKAALRHHPDKAGQFLARTESGDEGRLWKEIAHEVHKDADRLFKMIGEAYAVLSETNKRSEYDLEEEIRKASKESYQSSPYGRPSYANNYSSRRSANRQSRQENWKTYGNSYSRW